MIIRQVREEDLKSFVELYFKSYEDLGDYFYRTRKEAKAYFKWLYNRDCEGFFVAEEEEPIAFLASDANWFSFHLQEEVLEIHEIFVSPEHRRKGIASKLLEKAFSYGIKKRRNIAELYVGKTNYVARSFYEKHGFVYVDEFGMWIRMIRPLKRDLSQ